MNPGAAVASGGLEAGPHFNHQRVLIFESSNTRERVKEPVEPDASTTGSDLFSWLFGPGAPRTQLRPPSFHRTSRVMKFPAPPRRPLRMERKVVSVRSTHSCGGLAAHPWDGAWLCVSEMNAGSPSSSVFPAFSMSLVPAPPAQSWRWRKERGPRVHSHSTGLLDDIPRACSQGHEIRS